ILSLLEENVKRNELSDTCQVKGLDWQNEKSIRSVMDDLYELDYLIAADVFYDTFSYSTIFKDVLFEPEKSVEIVFKFV
ncbi:hypothetical protein COOONC_04929, partial [Cooperia oncophora]